MQLHRCQCSSRPASNCDYFFKDGIPSCRARHQPSNRTVRRICSRPEHSALLALTRREGKGPVRAKEIIQRCAPSQADVIVGRARSGEPHQYFSLAVKIPLTLGSHPHAMVLVNAAADQPRPSVIRPKLNHHARASVVECSSKQTTKVVRWLYYQYQKKTVLKKGQF